MPKRLMGFSVNLVAFAFALSLSCSANAQDNKLAAFMKRKLDHSQKILEGLAREDFDLIAKHSQAISLLCDDELWSVLQTPEYLERSREFRRNIYEITEAARKKNLDEAAFAYVESSMKCVSCHKYVRRTRERP